MYSDGRPIQQDMNNFNNGNKIGDLKKEILSSKICKIGLFVDINDCYLHAAIINGLIIFLVQMMNTWPSHLMEEAYSITHTDTV